MFSSLLSPPPPPLPSPRLLRRRLPAVQAIDAAQPFDLESRLSLSLSNNSQSPSLPKLKIAIVGFGNFGQFLAKTFSKQGHTLLAHSRTDYSSVASSMGANFIRDPHDLCESHPDVVILCTSILSAEKVLKSLPIQRLKRSTLFADVLSVKEFPRSLFMDFLPPDFDILCTHPMFGPESGKDGWTGLPFVYEKVRVGSSEDRIERSEAFLDMFKTEGCRMVEMSCKEHDEIAAEIQFLTHTVGRVLAKLGLKPTVIDTKGYETLLKLVENTCSDSFELYNGLFMYNKNSTELLDRLDTAIDELKKELYGRLHDILRKQLFDKPGKEKPVLMTSERSVVHN